MARTLHQQIGNVSIRCGWMIVAFAALVSFSKPCRAVEDRPPNVVVIFADDLGYGDLGCYGHPTIRTPHLDRMAAEGMKLTQFYAAACVCTPSRAALLTGRLPVRNGMCSNSRRVLFPDSKGGLPSAEITLAEGLKTKGYATACVGKWHLGHLPPFLPGRQGFDRYFGIPYSNDMDRVASVAPKGRAAFEHPKIEYWNVPLIRQAKVVERPADQNTITRRYTEEAVQFIKDNQDGPFFLYVPHSMPHVPLFRSADYAERSLRGLYGDVIEELDWSVGQILDTIRSLDLGSQTLVFFSSDNGPWLIFNQQGGSAGLLRGGKGSTWEGGMRVPTLAWWPDHIRPASVGTGMASTMDIFATAHALAGVELPSDRTLDSFDMTSMLLGTGRSKRSNMFYYRGYRLMAVRKGPWKMHLLTQDGYGQPKPVAHEPPLLYNLDNDPSEKNNLAKKHPRIIAQLREEIRLHEDRLQPAKSQLEL